MDARAVAREETRRRIVEAAIELHTRNGILGTSWREIAASADVSVGTVYNHFPSPDELVPACGEALMERLSPPSAEDLSLALTGVRSLHDRLERVASQLFSFYERGGAHLHLFPGEEELPAVRAWLDDLRGTIDVSVREALGRRHVPAATTATIAALLEFPTFEALRGRGLDAVTAAAEIARAAACLATRGPSSVLRPARATPREATGGRSI
jgi:AcrR family transcriptional regulator